MDSHFSHTKKNLVVLLESPYKVTIESGNEEDRFEVVENSTQAHIDSASSPEPTIYQNFTLNGEFIIVCPNNTNSSASGNIERSISASKSFEGITTEYALLVLKQPLDYESTPTYNLHLKVEDHGGRVGYVDVLVSDDFLVMCLVFL
jgi:hypothetical protein